MKLWVVLLAIWIAPAAVGGVVLLWSTLRGRPGDARRNKQHTNGKS